LSVIFVACSPKIVETVTVVDPLAPTGEVGSMSSEVINGKHIFENKCNRCHDLKTIKSYSRTQWETILPKMIEYAKLKTEERVQITAYVNWKLESD